MPVITLSRQFGAAGGSIGRTVAERFVAEFLDRRIIALLAERSGIPEREAEGYDERLPGLWQRIAAAFASTAGEPVVPPIEVPVLPGPAMQERMARLTRAIIEEAASSGNAVIVGRGGAFILGRREDTLNVQLHASLDDRVGYLVARVEEIPDETRPDDDALRELCRSIDAARERYLRRHFRVDWNDARHYDLSLDTGRLGLSGTVNLIEAAARGRS
ncbi:MAG: cytidylate kinase-like family protein [Chloroflexi bacterium]|nr:cytidylate kinase-like family protein [Chloroflexota bacterium]